jgi:hypothetical protein
MHLNTGLAAQLFAPGFGRSQRPDTAETKQVSLGKHDHPRTRSIIKRSVVLGLESLGEPPYIDIGLPAVGDIYTRTVQGPAHRSTSDSGTAADRHLDRPV